MEPLLAIAGLVFVGVITPGPNNLIVMSAAVAGGLRATMPPVAGVVTGTLGLLALAWAGVDLALSQAPAAKTVLKIAGTAYLIWLGVTMLRSDGMGSAESARPGGPRPTFAGLVLFQFLNPKSWVLVLTALAASPGGMADVLLLAAVFASLSCICLGVWGAMGLALSAWLQNARRRTWFDRAMGATLIVSALALLLDP